MDIVGYLNGFQIHFNKPTLGDKPKKYPKRVFGYVLCNSVVLYWQNIVKKNLFLNEPCKTKYVNFRSDLPHQHHRG
jgi:hypothetical protein